MSQDAQRTAKTGGKGKVILWIVLPLLLLLLGGAAAAVYLADMLPVRSGMAATGDPSQTDGGAPSARDIKFVALPDLLVNLNVSGTRLRFLKFAAALEVAGDGQMRAVEQLVPRITDNIHLYLRAIEPEDMNTAEGVYRIKRDLLARVNQVVAPAEVRDVLIKEMLVQ